MRELSRATVASRKKKKQLPSPWAEREVVLNDTLSLPQRKQGGCAVSRESAESGKETGVTASPPAMWGCLRHLGCSP